ncbi:TerC family protein [Blattabacterium cuenoti]|uniref:TerC family protein n=1 Tax=Blattabacterium cuenoti TaxID=1653831 RepID=UPI00163CF331|nr:DUF475 domain-containing protein [Blattabacterium cuenoti]
MIEYLYDIINNPFSSILTIGNLFIVESILSIDNAVVLSSIIMNLDNNEDRNKAIKYGTISAYLFRILCLLFTSILINMKWVKIIAGIYLIFTGINYYINKFKNKIIKNNKINTKNNSLWKIILYVELIDLSFSIDNVFASIAISKNLLLLFISILTSILSIRLSTKFFIKLVEKIPKLNNFIYMIIIILGVRLIINFFYEKNFIYNKFIEYISNVLMSLILIIPIIKYSFYNKFFIKKKS